MAGQQTTGSRSGGEAGRLVVISAPSGAGKTSLVRALLETDPATRFSTSFTTREPRPGERDGEDYFFVSTERFAEMVDASEFLEHACVFDNHYGTGRGQASRLMAAGYDVLLEIDWQGAAQVRKAMPDCLSIFIMPPSLEELERRLRGRSTDSDAVIRRRLQDARADMAHWPEFDFVVVNENFDEALAELRAVLAGRAAHLRSDNPAQRSRLAGMMA